MTRTYENGRWYHRGGGWLMVEADGRRRIVNRRRTVPAYSADAWAWIVVGADGETIASGAASYVGGARSAASVCDAPWRTS